MKRERRFLRHFVAAAYGAAALACLVGDSPGAPEASRRAVDALIVSLGDDDPARRAGAAAELERIAGSGGEGPERSRAVAALKAAAGDPDLEIRARADEILRRIGLGSDLKEIESLLDVMRKARDPDEGLVAYRKILSMGPQGTAAIEKEFAVDPERYGSREGNYRLEASLTIDPERPLGIGEWAAISVTLVNRGAVPVWIAPMGARLGGTLRTPKGRTIDLPPQPPDATAERLFSQALAGQTGSYDLIRLAPGESHVFAYEEQFLEEGTLRLSFNYGAPDHEATRKAAEQALALARAFKCETPDPAMMMAALPTPFKEVEAGMDVTVRSLLAAEGKPVFPPGQKAPFEE